MRGKKATNVCAGSFGRREHPWPKIFERIIFRENALASKFSMVGAQWI
jgi:hypothetical protein